jgi:hypothetical protein
MKWDRSLHQKERKLVSMFYEIYDTCLQIFHLGERVLKDIEVRFMK